MNLRGISLLILITSLDAVALKTSEEGAYVPCGTVQSLSGNIQVLDSERKSHLIVGRGNTVPCGAWVSTEAGKLELSLIPSGTITVMSNSLVEINDDVQLLKGKLYISNSKTDHVIDISTPQGVIQFESGFVFIDSQLESGKTQLANISGKSKFHQKLIPSEVVQLSAGEFSEVSLSGERMIPTAPSLLSKESLSSLLKTAGLGSNDIDSAVQKLSKKVERNIASLVIHAKKDDDLRSIETPGKGPSTEENRSDVNDEKIENIPNAHSYLVENDDHSAGIREPAKKEISKKVRPTRSHPAKLSLQKTGRAPKNSLEASEKKRLVAEIRALKDGFKD